MTLRRLGASTPTDAGAQMWELRLYVAGQSARSLAAVQNLRRLCNAYLPGRHHVDVIDLLKQPHLARSDQIVAVPTLIRRLPEPIRVIVGDLSNEERTLVGLQLQMETA